MINLSNYEEYFLLYIDNELSKEESQAVEAFVSQYPHLAAELDILQGAKLPPADAVVFSDKASLYKAADNSINIYNYEEYFLLHTDKELTVTQEDEVEQFVLLHPQLQEEFLLLQRAKLVPDNIEYPDKDRLYKKPAKRVIPLYLTRMAAAAVVAGVIVLTGGYLINNKGNHTQIASSATQDKPGEKIATPEKQMEVALPGKKQSEAVVTKNETKRTEQETVKAVRTGNDKPLPDANNGNNIEPVIVRIDPLPVTQQAMPAPEDNAAPQDGHVTGLKPLDETEDKESTSTVMYVSNDYIPAKPAVYKELNTDEDDQTLYIGALHLNKAKVNGLVKKVTHLLGTKSKESNL